MKKALIILAVILGVLLLATVITGTASRIRGKEFRGSEEGK